VSQSAEQNQKKVKEFMSKRKQIRTHHQTWKDLTIDEKFQNFFKGYLVLLQKTLRQKNRYDFYAVKDIIEERIGRKLLCECQLFNNEKAMRRKELERVFGVDFGSPGNRQFDII